MPSPLLLKALEVRKRRVLRKVGLAAMVLLLLTAVYRRAPIAFLRAESGFYLWSSQSSELVQHRTQREFVTQSYHGHWTPLAFLLEFWTTKLIGARGMAWHYRQLLLLTAVGLASLALVANMARSVGLRPAQQKATAVAVCAMFLFQPLMFEFVIWPFMGLQLMWMFFTLAACLSCVQLANDPKRIRWIWVGAGAAYASLHILGLGVAVTVSTAGVFALLIALSYQRDCTFKSARPHLFFAAILLLLLTCMHGLAMVFLLEQKNSVHAVNLTPGAVKLALEFTFRFVCAGLQSFALALPVPNNFPFERYHDWMHSPNHWSFGLLGCLGSAAIVYHMCRRAFLRPTAVRVLRASMILFSTIGVLLLIGLMICRQTLGQQEPYGMLPYYTAVPRYIIPLQVFLVGPLVLLTVSFARRASTIFTYACLGYALGALVIQTQFQRSPAALLTPQARVSHRTAWRQLVEAARECRAARLPLPNFSLVPLTEEWFGTEVKMFVPMLQRELGLGPTEELDLIAVADYRSGDRQPWQATPAVANFERSLEQAQVRK